MKASLIFEALKSLIAARQPVFVWGAPGIGKSSVVAQLAALLKVSLQDVRALLLDPVDLRGLPYVSSDGRSKWAVPDFLPAEGAGILFLDELNAAPGMVQAAFYQLVLDRRLGEYKLPDGWVIVAAGNRDSGRAQTTRMPSPLRNRFVHLDFEVDGQEWSAWAISAGIRPEVIAFIRFRPQLLSAFDRDANAFPSPRSWEFVSRILDGSHSAVEHEMFAGAVGSGAATEFSGFLKMFRELPNLDAILLNPRGEPLPESPAAQYAGRFGTRPSSVRHELRSYLPIPGSYVHRVPRADSSRRDPARSEHQIHRWIQKVGDREPSRSSLGGCRESAARRPHGPVARKSHLAYTNVYASGRIVLTGGVNMPRTAKIFMNNRSQAVRLPKEFQFNAREVFIRREGSDVILSPRPSDWSSYLNEAPVASQNFMQGVEDLPVQEREP